LVFVSLSVFRNLDVFQSLVVFGNTQNNFGVEQKKKNLLKTSSQKLWLEQVPQPQPQPAAGHAVSAACSWA